VAVFATSGLIDVLVEFAADREPQEANIPLGTTPAGDLSGSDSRLADLDEGTPVISHFYLPDAGSSVNSVFGMDLGTPSGSAQARFISHPTGPLGISTEDDLAGVVLVATPPWEADTVTAFDRSGATIELVVLDAEPPVERIE
jgi:hypothetical protein